MTFYLLSPLRPLTASSKRFLISTSCFGPTYTDSFLVASSSLQIEHSILLSCGPSPEGVVGGSVVVDGGAGISVGPPPGGPSGVVVGVVVPVPAPLPTGPTAGPSLGSSIVLSMGLSALSVLRLILVVQF